MQSEWQAAITRRTFIGGASAAILLAGCGGDGEQAAKKAPSGAAPGVEFTEPPSKLSGDLKILLWSHFVPRHDKWFDAFARDWGQKVGVNVTVDHIDVNSIPARIESEIGARSGHDLIEYIAPLAQFEPSVVDMADVTQEAERRFGKQIGLSTRSSLNPTTKKYFAYSPAWAPDPGNYRRSLWEAVGLPNGPASWDDLLRGGAEIKSKRNVQVGLGMSQEVDSNMAGRALLWSFGGAVQDENENVTINTPETVAAVEYMKKLYDQAMTQEVFAWNPASNNQGLIAGKLSYILNSISAYRTLQQVNPTVADDVFFVPALKGPKATLVAQHVMYNWIAPKHAKNVDAAKAFLLHYTENLARVAWESELYDLPAFPERVPKINDWLDNDPFGSKPANKLAVLKDALDWSANVGYQGSANTAVGEAFGTFIVPTMYAQAARGKETPQRAVEKAEAQLKPIFEKWRKRGLMGAGSTA